MSDKLRIVDSRYVALPCPFCGGEATPNHAWEDGVSYLYCKFCGARTRDFHDIKDAYEVWNERYPVTWKAEYK